MAFAKSLNTTATQLSLRYDRDKVINLTRRVGITGIVLSKMDGDARGGAALSVVSVAV